MKLSMLLCLAVAVSSCTATQTAALKADASAAASDLASDFEACESPQLQSQAVAAAPCIDLGSASADLACVGKLASADASQVAICAAKKAITQAEGSAITTTELAKLEVGARNIIAKLVARKTTAAPTAAKS